MSTNEVNFDSAYFETILNAYFNKEAITVVSHSVGSAVEKGENFGSVVLRAKVNYWDGNKDSSISLILKVCPDDNEALTEVLTEFQIFARELATYKEILIECDNQLQAIGVTFNLSPK